MDNLAHTLVGVALADAGLKRRTALGTATLAIGANLPDVDVFVYLVGDGLDALVFRRGWTHGVLAMVVFPFALAGVMLAWDRLVRRQRLGETRPPVRGWWLVALAAAGIWSHPLLDLLNTYGVRLLMPFSSRWFYGDTLFIIDLWIWLALGAGIALTRLRQRRAPHRPPTPARLTLGLLTGYVAAMATWSAVGRGELRAIFGPGARVMAAPVPLAPLARSTIADLGDRYAFGHLGVGSGRRYIARGTVPSGRAAPEALAAARTHEGAAFLSWSRFPQFTLTRVRNGTRVHIADLRYGVPGEDSWASVAVTVPGAD